MSDFDENKIRRLDGTLLLVFRELLRTRRATSAAEQLRLSSSAISHALTRLRDLFDDPLFIRRPHGFEPTRRALELGPRIEALIELTGQALSGSEAFDPQRSRRFFRFAAPEFVTALIGAELINQLKVSAPGVTFGLGFTAEADAFRALRRGQIDFALGRFDSDRPGFTRELLFEDRYCVAARQGHPAVGGELNWKAWRDAGHIFAWSPSEVGADSEEAAPGEQVARLAVVPQWVTALLLAAGSDGLVTCPRRLAERYAGRLGLQVLDPPFDPHPVAVSVVRRAGVADPGLDWFLEEVRRAVGP